MNTNTISTVDLSQFGYREIDIAGRLLAAYLDNVFILGDGVQISFNTYSGNVFLMDEDYNVAMFNGEKLEKFYTCSNCGYEGFAGDFDPHPKRGASNAPPAKARTARFTSSPVGATARRRAFSARLLFSCLNVFLIG